MYFNISRQKNYFFSRYTYSKSMVFTSFGALVVAVVALAVVALAVVASAFSSLFGGGYDTTCCNASWEQSHNILQSCTERIVPADHQAPWYGQEGVVMVVDPLVQIIC